MPRFNSIEIPCAHCGKPLLRNPSRIAKQNKHFCNAICKGAWQTAHIRGETSPTWRDGGKPITSVCEQCGKPHQAYPSAPRRFCSQACWNASRQPTAQTWTCKGCGVSFERVQNTDRVPKYCSVECRRKYVIPPGTEPVPLKTNTCATCGVEFEFKRSVKRKYCSKKCNDVGRAGKRMANYKGKYLSAKCQQCGADIECYPHRLKKFCNEVCYAKWQSENLSGENSYEWQGGAVDYRGPNWDEQADAARERDDHRCQHCGVSEVKLGRSLDVHHLIPFRRFGVERYIEANDLSNLISLCRSCHIRTEKGGLVLQLSLIKP